MSFVEKWVKQDHYIQQDKSDPERQILHEFPYQKGDYKIDGMKVDVGDHVEDKKEGTAQGREIKDSQILALSTK